MASKAFSLILFTFLLPLPSHGTSRDTNNKKSSPFDFLKHLEGCHKGDNVSGIKFLKSYLEQFGYLNHSHSVMQNHANDDDFDEPLESALKTYQLNFHLNTTGTLDAKTISNMMMPRYGVADIINGTNWMRTDNKNHDHNHGSFHTISHYAFFPRNHKWPVSKYNLTYGFLTSTPGRAMLPVAQAFRTWAANTHFTFSRAEDTTADLQVGFKSRDHGDGFPFNRPGGLLAHAFPPTDCRLHYDADDQWSVGAVPGQFDLEAAALHEIGHLLGLQHSNVQGAIMWPHISQGMTKGLDKDDMDGIKALYNVCLFGSP